MIRIFRHSLAAICLLLLLAIGVLWASPRVIWWSHRGNFPSYHLATISKSGLVLARYRETGSSDMKRFVYACEEALNRVEERLPQEEGDFEIVDIQKTDPAEVARARATLEHLRNEFPRRQAALLSARAYELPGETGLHSARAGVRVFKPAPLVPSMYIPQRSDGDNLLDCISPTPADTTRSFLGVSDSTGANRYAQWRRISIPFYVLIPPLLVFPCPWLLGIIRARRRRRSGCCEVCGYDLRASPGVCPECGAGRGVQTVGNLLDEGSTGIGVPLPMPPKSS